MPSTLQSLRARYGTSDPSKIRRFLQPYWDYVWYPAAGITSLSFFSIALGGRDPNAPGVTQLKTLEDTNLMTPRRTDPNDLFVYEIRTHIRLAPKNRQNATIAADGLAITRGYGDLAFQSQLAQLFRGARLRLLFDNKRYVNINQPFTAAPAGFGLNIKNFASAGTIAPAVSQIAWQQSNPDNANVYACDPPIMVSKSQIIDCFIDWPAGDQPVFTNLVLGVSPSVQIGVILNGEEFRPYQ